MVRLDVRVHRRVVDIEYTDITVDVSEAKSQEEIRQAVREKVLNPLFTGWRLKKTVGQELLEIKEDDTRVLE